MRYAERLSEEKILCSFYSPWLCLVWGLCYVLSVGANRQPSVVGGIHSKSAVMTSSCHSTLYLYQASICWDRTPCERANGIKHRYIADLCWYMWNPGALGEMGRVRVIPTELSSCRSPEYFPLDEGHSRKGTRGLYLPTVYFLKPCYDVVIWDHFWNFSCCSKCFFLYDAVSV